MYWVSQPPATAERERESNGVQGTAQTGAGIQGRDLANSASSGCRPGKGPLGAKQSCSGGKSRSQKARAFPWKSGGVARRV